MLMEHTEPERVLIKKWKGKGVNQEQLNTTTEHNPT